LILKLSISGWIGHLAIKNEKELITGHFKVVIARFSANQLGITLPWNSGSVENFTVIKTAPEDLELLSFI
jgi:hypothetical protein